MRLVFHLMILYGCLYQPYIFIPLKNFSSVEYFFVAKWTTDMHVLSVSVFSLPLASHHPACAVILQIQAFPECVTECLLTAMRHGSDEARQRFPRLLQFVSPVHPAYSVRVLTTFRSLSAALPSWMCISWISQMVAILDKEEATAVQPLLKSISQHYPQVLDECVTLMLLLVCHSPKYLSHLKIKNLAVVVFLPSMLMVICDV